MTETGYDLPAVWARATLSDIGTWTGGGTPSKRQPAFWTDGTIPWVSPKDMKTDFLAEAEDTITERAVEESSAKLVGAGSVLFVTRSGILRHTLPVAVNRVDVTVNQDLKALTPGTGIEPAYVLRFVQAFNREMLHATAKDGTTVQSVQTKKLYDYPIPVAPTAEQRRIVDALEAAFADLDAGIAAIEAAQRNLERYRRSVLKAAVEGALTADWRRQHPDVEPASVLLERVLIERRERWEADQLVGYEAKGKTPPKNWRQRYKPPIEPTTDELGDPPEGWMRSSLDGLLEYVTSGSRGWSRFYSDTGPLFVRVGDLSHESLHIALEGAQRVALPESTEGARSLLQPRDILVSITADIGMVGLVPDSIEEAYINQHVALARPVDPNTSRFIAIYLAAPDGGKRQLVKVQRGATKAGLGLNDIRGVNIPLPPLAEQAAIVEAVEERLSVAAAAAADLDRQRARADRLRQAVLKRAFTGEFVPQDPTDQPATVLLERVHKELAEREKTTTPRKRKRTMSTPEPTSPASLVEIVEAEGPIQPQDLWTKSKDLWKTPEGDHSVDAFYAALKVEVTLTKRLVEQKPSDNHRLIVLA